MVNTPYDDVFRTLLTDCTALIIPVVNELFHTNPYFIWNKKAAQLLNLFFPSIKVGISQKQSEKISF